VLLILTDDQGSVDVGAYGSDDLHTPNMDRLAREGLKFTQFYAGAPVCSPSRAALLTGRSPNSVGVGGNGRPMDVDVATMADVFLANGYRTGHVGKWHLGSDPTRFGFQRWFGHLSGCIDNYSHDYHWGGPNTHDLYKDGRETWMRGEFVQDLYANEANDFIRSSANASQPFFLYFAVNAPHYPYQGDPELLRGYEARGVRAPRSVYGAFLSTTDRTIGRLLHTLDELGLSHNTIVAFQSDNGHSVERAAHGGGGSAGPYRGAKFSLFEGGIRVPAMLRWPGHIAANASRAHIATTMDWLPTLADMTGIQARIPALAGKSLVPLIRDSLSPSPHAGSPLMWDSEGAWAVRKGPWKLHYHPQDPTQPNAYLEEFFLVNLEEDIGENNNVAEDNVDLVKGLKDIYRGWAASGFNQPSIDMTTYNDGLSEPYG